MLDIKRIRTDFDTVAEKLATRGVDAAILNEMKEIDAKRRDILVKVAVSYTHLTLPTKRIV